MFASKLCSNYCHNFHWAYKKLRTICTKSSSLECFASNDSSSSSTNLLEVAAAAAVVAAAAAEVTATATAKLVEGGLSLSNVASNCFEMIKSRCPLRSLVLYL